MRPYCLLLALAASLCWSVAAQAHFLWVVTQPAERAASVKVYFSESATPDDPDLLDRVTAAEVRALGGRRSEPQVLSLKKGEDALEADVPATHQSSPVVLRHTYGVISRGGETFLLKYYGKAYPSALPGTWTAVEDAELLPLEVVPTLDGRKAVLHVSWQGKPLGGAAVTVSGPGLDEELELTTDENGSVTFPVNDAGLFSIRAKHVETASGEHEGDAYNAIRHYSTLTLRMVPPQMSTAAHNWPPLPKGITSFGGAVVGDWLYVYGGHYGQAHHYSREGQSGDFARLNLRDPQQWEPLPGGPKRTGLAMVAHEGKLYRIGGFSADNGEDEEQNLHSHADFARFDPQTRQWESLPPLPEGRSSHDAAVLGDTLYVVGGWTLRGDEERHWHDTAWSVDLSADTLQWQPLTNPPFHRRAVALAAWNGKLYCLGGMREEGGPTTAVAVYDPKAKTWSEGPALLGTAMDGFGASTFACDGGLFATTMSGSVQRLSAEGDRWEVVGQLEHPRFFHRLLPWQDRELVVVGGAHMAVGKIAESERLPVKSLSAPAGE